MAEPERAGILRTVAFVTAYGLSAIAVTVIFWRSPSPSADSVTPLTAASSTSTSGSAPAVGEVGSTTLAPALTQSAALSSNAAYGISGSAAFVNASTILVKQLSLNGTGPNVQLELRDRSDQMVAVLRDLTKLTLKQEDLVLAVPATVDVSAVSSLAIVATDFKLVLSRASWR